MKTKSQVPTDIPPRTREEEILRLKGVIDRARKKHLNLGDDVKIQWLMEEISAGQYSFFELGISDEDRRLLDPIAANTSHQRNILVAINAYKLLKREYDKPFRFLRKEKLKDQAARLKEDMNEHGLSYKKCGIDKELVDRIANL